MKNGAIGCAPTSPTVAISFNTLRAFRLLHRVNPRLSRQAFVRFLCHMHELPYRTYLSTQFTIAYDAYLEIVYSAQQRCDVVLGRTTPDWRMKNVCAPCTYKLENEDELKFNIIVSIDGNSSLKLVGEEVRAGQFVKDERTGRTDMWLTKEQVDEFKDSVVHHYF